MSITYHVVKCTKVWYEHEGYASERGNSRPLPVLFNWLWLFYQHHLLDHSHRRGNNFSHFHVTSKVFSPWPCNHFPLTPFLHFPCCVYSEVVCPYLYYLDLFHSTGALYTLTRRLAHPINQFIFTSSFLTILWKNSEQGIFNLYIFPSVTRSWLFYSIFFYTCSFLALYSPQSHTFLGLLSI